MKRIAELGCMALALAIAGTGCASMPTPSDFAAGVLCEVVGAFMPDGRSRRRPSAPSVSHARPAGSAAGRSVPSTRPATPPPAPSSPPPPPVARSMAPSVVPTPPAPTTAPTLVHLPAQRPQRTQADLPAPSQAPWASAPSRPERPPAPTGPGRFEQRLEHIIALYRGFQYEEALQLAAAYVKSAGPSREERTAAAFIGASAAYVANRPELMEGLLRLAVNTAPHLKPDPDTLPGPVCARHQELLKERRD